LVSFNGTPAKAQVDALLKALPNRHDSALPAILNFVPRGEVIPNSARYVLGSDSLAAFAPEFKPEMARLLNPVEGMKSRTLLGGTAPSAVAAALAEAKLRLAAMKK